MPDTIYTIKDGNIGVNYLEDCSKVDGHVHSIYSGKYPDRFIGSPITRLMRVRESYTRPEEIRKIGKKRGMTLFAIADHDSVLGALELRKKHPEDSFVNGEYTARIGSQNPGQVVHIGCWGIDYAQNSRWPLPDKEVMKIHNELLVRGRVGYKAFINFCKNEGIAHCLNHPLWQANPKKPFSGSLIDEISSAFDVFEINGDCQSENVFTMELALSKNKKICAGSDSHYRQRIANEFTAALYPVKSPHGFIDAFKKGDIGIGSQEQLPEGIEPSLENIVEYCFNGTIADLVGDAYVGHKDYALRDWGKRKWATAGVLFGIPLGLGGVLAPFIGVLTPIALDLFLFSVEAFLIGSIPYAMAIRERKSVEKRTKDIYREYNGLLAEREIEKKFSDKELEEAKKIIKGMNEIKADYGKKELPKMARSLGRWGSFIDRLLRLESLDADYDWSKEFNDSRQEEDTKKEKS